MEEITLIWMPKLYSSDEDPDRHKYSVELLIKYGFTPFQPVAFIDTEVADICEPDTDETSISKQINGRVRSLRRKGMDVNYVVSHNILMVEKGEIRRYYGLAFCSTSEQGFDFEFGRRMARKKAVRHFIHICGWEQAIKLGLIKGDIPVDKEEVIGKRYHRKQKRLHTRIDRFSKLKKHYKDKLAIVNISLKHMRGVLFDEEEASTEGI